MAMAGRSKGFQDMRRALKRSPSLPSSRHTSCQSPVAEPCLEVQRMLGGTDVLVSSRASVEEQHFRWSTCNKFHDASFHLVNDNDAEYEERVDPFSLVADQLSVLANRLCSMVTSEVSKLASAAEYFFKTGVEGKRFRPMDIIEHLRWMVWGEQLLAEQLLAWDHVGTYPSFTAPALVISDFSVVKCTATPRRPRPRINNSGTSNNIGVMTKLREEGWFDEAMEILDKMDRQGMEITSNVLLCLLQEAIKRKDLKQGRELHRLTKNHNLESDTFLGTFLIRFYTTCGYLEEAIEAFGKVSESDMSVYTWSAMILAHARLGNAEDGLKIFDKMLQQSSLKPEENVFVAALEACATIPSLAEGQRVHKSIMEHNLMTNVNIGCAVIDMFTKCGSFDEARKVFERLPKRELVVWNSMIATYSHFKRIPEALRLVQVLQQERLKPNDVTFAAILKACSCPGDLESGKHIHAQIVQIQYDTNMAVASVLIDMYSRCGSVEGVMSVFDKLRQRDGSVWNAMVSGFIHLGLASRAVHEFVTRIQQEVSGLNETLVPLLRACHSASMFDEVKRIHARVLGGHKLDPAVGTALIETYCKANNFKDARAVLNKYTCKPLGMWTSIICGFAKQRLGQDALLLLKEMLQDGTKPTPDIIISMLESCCSQADLNLGEQIHSHILDYGLKSNPHVDKAVAEMYARCGRVEEAQNAPQIMSNI